MLKGCILLSGGVNINFNNVTDHLHFLKHCLLRGLLHHYYALVQQATKLKNPGPHPCYYNDPFLSYLITSYICRVLHSMQE